jgi:hypothetical protein
VAETLSPTRAGFGPPMPPDSVHRGGGAESADGATAPTAAPMATTASSNARRRNTPGTQGS